jgi:hypothetical protein
MFASARHEFTVYVCMPYDITGFETCACPRLGLYAYHRVRNLRVFTLGRTVHVLLDVHSCAFSVRLSAAGIDHLSAQCAMHAHAAAKAICSFCCSDGLAAL